MTVAPTSKKLTYEDYLDLPERDGEHYEIIDGELFVTPSPIEKHQRIVVNLLHFLSNHVFEHRCGRLYVMPFDVVLSSHDVVQPDLLYITKERAAAATQKNLQGAPDFVVEILSDATKKADEGAKLRRYELFGVNEYWIVDPKSDRVRVHLRKGDRLEQVMNAGAGDTLTSAFFPGFELAVSDVFADW
ncbi:MAG: Uma2 family endonuclease [Acidobacteria bacterium]|nr:Uma2 family endonuclease [Acidobacteriota bacterium]